MGALYRAWAGGSIVRHNDSPMNPSFILVLLTVWLALPLQAQEYLSSQKMDPRRIVSIGLCTDQLLLMMVERERIASVTRSAANPEESYMAATIGDIPLNDSDVEEIIALGPDLVVGSPFASQDTARLLQELGYRVEMSTPPRTLAALRESILQFGVWTGAEARAQEIVNTMDRRLADIQSVYGHKPQRSIMVYSPNGYTIGSDTLEDEIFRAAGYRNLSAAMGITGFQTISLEQLVAAQPDFIQIDNYIYNQNSLASSYINHPVLKVMMPEKRRLYMPTIWRDCAGPMAVDAIEYLASHR